MSSIETFATADEAADATAAAIAARLAHSGPRKLLVTGGSAPGAVYDRLSRMDLDWPQVTVTLSDERFVPTDHDLSNERMVRERLLKGHAAGATLQSLRRPDPADLD